LLGIPDIVHIGKEAQHGVSAAVHACDMKMFSLAYVSGFIAKHLLNNSNYDTCKNCLISEVPSPLNVYTSFKEHSNTVHSLTYPTEKVVETWYYCDFFEVCDIKAGSLRVS
jgi:hypothetical protein